MNNLSIQKLISRAEIASLPVLTRLFEHRPLKERLRSYNVIRAMRPMVRRDERAALRHIMECEEAPFFSIDHDRGAGPITLDSSLVERCVVDTQQRLNDFRKSEGIVRNKKGYLQSLTALGDYSANSAPFQLATSPKLIKSIANYLGTAPVLWNIAAMYSPVNEAKEMARSSVPVGNEVSGAHNWRGSQLWHRDAEDVTSLKIWILCSPVDQDSGPTSCLPRRVSDKIAAEIGYKQGSKISDDQVLSPHASEILALTGSVGDAFATDTCRCFHMGSRTMDPRGRLVLMLNYVTRYSLYFWPVFSSNTKRRINSDTNGLSSIQKDLLFPYNMN